MNLFSAHCMFRLTMLLNISQSLALSHFIQLMLNIKNRLYRFTPRDEETEKISDIYSLINKQEKSIEDILQKYGVKNNSIEPDRTQKLTYATVDINKKKGKSQDAIKRKSATRLQHIALQLPSLSLNKSQQKGRSRKSQIAHYDNNPYFKESIKNSEEQQIKKALLRAYFTQRTIKLNRSKSKHSQNKKQIQSKSKQTNQKLNSIKINRQMSQPAQYLAESYQQQNNVKHEIPQPLGYLDNFAESESSSEQGDVPLNYYQKEYRVLIRQQSLEEINFLYFSKNQSMKDWTESLLLLFQKHDKQLLSLRKKCRYLQKFDINFFSIDIFREA